MNLSTILKAYDGLVAARDVHADDPDAMADAVEDTLMMLLEALLEDKLSRREVFRRQLGGR